MLRRGTPAAVREHFSAPMERARARAVSPLGVGGWARAELTPPNPNGLHRRHANDSAERMDRQMRPLKNGQRLGDLQVDEREAPAERLAP